MTQKCWGACSELGELGGQVLLPFLSASFVLRPPRDIVPHAQNHVPIGGLRK